MGEKVTVCVDDMVTATGPCQYKDFLHKCRESNDKDNHGIIFLYGKFYTGT